MCVVCCNAIIGICTRLPNPRNAHARTRSRTFGHTVRACLQPLWHKAFAADANAWANALTGAPPIVRANDIRYYYVSLIGRNPEKQKFGAPLFYSRLELPTSGLLPLPTGPEPRNDSLASAEAPFTFNRETVMKEIQPESCVMANWTQAAIPLK